MALQDLILFGAGGLGRVVLFQMLDVAKKQAQYNILGFVDDTPELQNKKINNYSVLGNSEWLMDYSKDVCVAVCVAKPMLRKKVVDKIQANTHIDFPTLFADGVKCADSVKFGKGCIISIYNILTADIEIGDFFFSSHFCMIGHDVRIKDYVTMYANVNIGGGVEIDSFAEFSTGSIVIPRIHVGENATVGLGSAAYHTVQSNTTVVGVPAMKKFSK